MGRLFVVDTENTNDYSFIDNYEINSEDEIVLFISDNMKGIKSDGCIALLNTNAKVITEKIETGEKNSLDFQLIVYVTERAINGSYEEILINTRDHGYRQVIKYISNKLYKNISIISRDRIRKEEQAAAIKEEASKEQSVIKEEVAISTDFTKENLKKEEKIQKKVLKNDKPKKELSPEEHVVQKIKEIVPNATEEQINNILKMKSRNLLLRKLHDELLKTFKEDGKKIYGEIKMYMKK